ncbi:casein kinase I-like [Oppia nitens]|uniref:casein kinase I-like n=1 Tax=Oppia nitens TaxID=1686743 RepID=UPI0023D999EA|nr:casein kinase I-like [Oppia nitens]
MVMKSPVVRKTISSVVDKNTDTLLGQKIEDSGHRFRLGSVIGSGTYGQLRQGFNLNNNNQLVAIKLENKRHSQLDTEYRFYKEINDRIRAKDPNLKITDGFARIDYFCHWRQYKVLVFEMLGRNLGEAFVACGQQFTLKTVVYIFLQLLQRIETVHTIGIVHRDIKPENFVLGCPGTRLQNCIHIIDFGLAAFYINPDTKRHIEMQKKDSLLGTARYISINGHLGKELSRRDDLESIGYLMMYFVKQGKLPWSGLKAPTDKDRFEMICECKRATPIETLCNGYPEQFAEYLRKVRCLRFKQTPDYTSLKNIFIKLFHREGCDDDGQYDWNSI